MSLELSFTVSGEGPPLLILHGLFGSARNWGAISKKLAESHRVYALDLRNHGGSPWAASMTYREMAGDVRALGQALTQRAAGGPTLRQARMSCMTLPCTSVSRKSRPW